LFILATLALIFCAGGYLGQATFKPQVIVDHEIRTIDRIIEKITYEPIETVIEKVVYKPVETTVIQRIKTPTPLSRFQNLDELKQWLGNIGVLDIRFDVVDEEISQRVQRFDCDDYAIRLQEKAMRDGYMMSFEVIHPIEYNALFKEKRIPDGAIHAVNSVILRNKVYYIEPQTREVVFAAYLD